MVSFLAHFDGKHLLPDEPVALPTDKPLRVTVEEVATLLRKSPDEVYAMVRDGSIPWFNVGVSF